MVNKEVTNMIVNLLIIPLSLPTIFIALFYSLARSNWFLSLTHLSAMNHIQGMTTQVLAIFLLALAMIGLIAILLTAMLVAALNRKASQKFRHRHQE
jgi:predicted branched-subunit amino acid permease